MEFWRSVCIIIILEQSSIILGGRHVVDHALVYQYSEVFDPVFIFNQTSRSQMNLQLSSLSGPTNLSLPTMPIYTNFRTITIHTACIFDIENGFFTKIGHLHKIILKKITCLHEMKASYFNEPLKYLKELTLFSFEDLNYVDPTIFRYMPNLGTLSITETNLKFIRLPKLLQPRYVNISHNLLELIDFQVTNVSVKVNALHNPLKCNCQLESFINHILHEKQCSRYR